MKIFKVFKNCLHRLDLDEQKLFHKSIFQLVRIREHKFRGM